MPYNTRRKSLSLPSLGIHVPISNAARAAAKNLANAASDSNTSSSSSKSMAPPLREDRVSRRLKRAHSESEGSDDDVQSAPPAKKRDSTVKFENTPPPSPPRSNRASIEMADDDEDEVKAPKEIDMDSINDEIVEAVIVQLQKTGNRPHLVKELAAVLMQQLKIVQLSANPCAIISSRLATYLKRHCWSALNPCPLGKELETVHPRRTYFYLTTCPHQPLPDPAHAATLSQLAAVQAVARAIISPALSSVDTTSNSEDVDDSRRRELSPSPEVDLSSPEFDDVDDDAAMPATPIGSFSMRGGYNYFTNGGGQKSGTGSGRHHHNRATSPPLEKDEKEFTQTANGLQKRKLRGELLSSASPETEQTSSTTEADFGNRDDSGLFGTRTPYMAAAHLDIPNTGNKDASSTFGLASPAMRPSVMPLNFSRKETTECDTWGELLDTLDWNRSPETIELDELDFLLNDY